VLLDSLEYGGKNITNIISKFEKISPQDAEKSKRQSIKNKKIEKEIILEFKKKVIGEIENSLKKTNLLSLLPAGVVAYGGGSRLGLLQESLKKELSMPVKRNEKHIYDNQTDYDNIYASIVSHIRNEVSQNKLDFRKTLKAFKSLFSKK
jgi:cell division ATPase FtsA